MQDQARGVCAPAPLPRNALPAAAAAAAFSEHLRPLWTAAATLPVIVHAAACSLCAAAPQDEDLTPPTPPAPHLLLSPRFDDVKGVDEAKYELEEIVEYLKAPEKFTKLGGKLPKVGVGGCVGGCVQGVWVWWVGQVLVLGW